MIIRKNLKGSIPFILEELELFHYLGIEKRVLLNDNELKIDF